MHVDPRRSAKLALALGTIYLVWGSSFLFSKIGVDHLPAALFAGARFLTAGCVLALVARYWRGEPWPAVAVEYRHVAIAGLCMVFASNGLNVWAIQFLPSHEAALLNGTSALWIAGLGVFGRRGHPLSARALLGLGIGFAGMTLMLAPGAHPHPASSLAKLGVLAGCFAWALGTLYYRSVDTRMGPLMFVALQMIFGGALLLAVGFADGEAARWTISLPGMISLGYLTFVSSCLAYSAYGWLALNTTPAVIGTYSYVNPAIATFLGWQFLGEELTRAQVAGMIVVIAGVLVLTTTGAGAAGVPALQSRRTIT